MGDKYVAFVEADCGIVPRREFDSAEEAEEWLKEHVDTGDLGPLKVRNVEIDD